MSLKVLLLEDDPEQRNDLKQRLEHEFHAQVESTGTESEFRAGFEGIAAKPPDVAILDVMVRWTKLTQGLSIPEDAKKPETAGLRCARMLRENEKTKNVKILLYSVSPNTHLGDESIPEGVNVIVKETDFEDLISKISELELDKLSA